MHEGIPILNYLVPTAFVHENGKLTGMRFDRVVAQFDDKGRRKLVSAGEPEQFFPCDDVLIAVGQENAFPWIESDAGIDFDEWGMPRLDPKSFQSSLPKVFLAVMRLLDLRTLFGPWPMDMMRRFRSTSTSRVAIYSIDPSPV